MNAFILTFTYFLLAIIVVLIGLVIFEWITTKYKDWEEIANDNQAVALSVAGKIVGICIILAFAIYHSVTIWETVIWGGYGVILQMIAYVLFELFTRKFSVQQKVKENNMAVGIISFAVSLGLAFVIGASIT
ncbi:UPF0719 inner membrane protein YjfL [Paraliobacillus ryukyuensis]|uniref:Putative membrane protein n=1 Tax=Paraliobacillus ryukyuensis TaxID=200904 RepID=A0A366ECD1_9BACI|nr:DUF350 domain-containing protein [Paraliobacillus ryukyuensis]RBO99389.1 putative membrane protein [Paraliobacillus ryukyuensis]